MLRAGHEDAGRSVHQLRIIEQAQRRRHQARCLVILHGDGIAPHRGGIERRMAPERNRNRGKVAAGGAVTLEVRLGGHGGARVRRIDAVHRVLPMPAPAFARRLAVRPAASGASALFGGQAGVHAGSAQGSHAGHHAGHARRNGHGGLLNAGSGEAAVSPGLAVHLQVEAEHLGQRVRISAVGRAHADDQAVDVRRCKPRVFRRAADGVGGQVDGAAIQLAPVRRMANPADGGTILQFQRGHLVVRGQRLSPGVSDSAILNAGMMQSRQFFPVFPTGRTVTLPRANTAPVRHDAYCVRVACPNPSNSWQRIRRSPLARESTG